MTNPHTPQFITDMKQQLLKEEQVLLEELKNLASFPDYGRSDEDNATEMADYTSSQATTEAAKQRLKEVEEALERIKRGTYGVTNDGKTIPENRLRANPAATTIV